MGGDGKGATCKNLKMTDISVESISFRVAEMNSDGPS